MQPWNAAHPSYAWHQSSGLASAWAHAQPSGAAHWAHGQPSGAVHGHGGWPQVNYQPGVQYGHYPNAASVHQPPGVFGSAWTGTTVASPTSGSAQVWLTWASAKGASLEVARNFLAELGGGNSTTLQDIFNVPAPDVAEALRAHRYSPGLLPIQRGVITSLLTVAAAELGVKPLELGQTKLAETTGSSRKMSSVIDQSLDSDVPIIKEGDVRKLFSRFDAENGGKPLKHEEPTGVQLQALKEIVQADCAPYADFGVWGPFGRRQAKLMKYSATIL